MTLSVRPHNSILPSYSLTGDLLSFLRCGLQYRYAQPGNLRPPHSSQQWFAQFLQQVLEEAWLASQQHHGQLPPWPESDTRQLLDHVNERLESQGIRCTTAAGAEYGRQRAAAALNELAPLLFPLLTHFPLRTRCSRPPNYELTAVIHGIARLCPSNPLLSDNPLVRMLCEQLPTASHSTIELVVDFRGSERPENSDAPQPINDPHCWQMQAAAHLRAPNASAPLAAGLMIHLNELVPGRSHFIALRKALLQQPRPTLLPDADSPDARILQTWRPHDPTEPPPLLSLQFRLRRALRFIPIDPQLQQQALHELDQIARRIITCQSRESATGQILTAWDRNPSHPPTCEACDARTWCPEFPTETQPALPAVQPRPNDIHESAPGPFA
jgi:hypothetical protein